MLPTAMMRPALAVISRTTAKVLRNQAICLAPSGSSLSPLNCVTKLLNKPAAGLLSFGDRIGMSGALAPNPDVNLDAILPRVTKKAR
jgi:hypothetical protein